MARTIREYREAGTVRLLRAQKTAQATIDSFPDPVVVVDPQGCVERANPAAQRLLQAIPAEEDDSVPWIAPSSLQPHLASVLGGNGDYLPAEPGSGDVPARRQPGSLLPAARAADPQRFGRAARGGGRALRRDQVSPGRSAQERHDLDRQPRAENAADQPPDGRAPAARGSRRSADDQADRAAPGRPAGLRSVAGDDQRPARPDQDRAGKGRAGPGSGRPVRARARDAVERHRVRLRGCRHRAGDASSRRRLPRFSWTGNASSMCSTTS